MYCPNCGEEIYLTDSFNNIDWLYCENCEQVHSIRSHKDASKQVDSMKVSHFQKKIRDSGRPRINHIKSKKFNAHNPNERIDAGELRVRYTRRNAKGA